MLLLVPRHVLQPMDGNNQQNLTPTPKYNKHLSSGFTLVELIVVLAGLGILASLAIPNFLKYLEQAKIDQAKSLLNSAAAECLQMYRSEGNVQV